MRRSFLAFVSCLAFSPATIYPCASNFSATQTDYTKVTLHWTNDSCGATDHLGFRIIDAQQNVSGSYIYSPLGTAGQLEINNFFLNTENQVDVTWLENASEFLERWSFTTLAAPPGALSNHFQSVESRSVTVSWWSNGVSGQINPIGTNYQIQFAEDAGFNGPLVETNSPEYGNLISKKVGCLSPGTTYFARIRAINRVGIPTAFLVLGSTVTRPDSPPPTDYLWGSNRWGLTLAPAEISSEDSMAFNETPLVSPLQSASLPGQILEANQKMLGIGDARRRPLPNGLAEIQTSRACPAHYDEDLSLPAQLSFNFTSTAGKVETGAGPVQEETLSFYRLEPLPGVWIKIPSQVEGGKVTASVRKLGTLAVMGQQATSLEDVRTRPNPFRLQDNTGVTFDNMAEVATLHIYTPSGREVRRLEETDGDGQLNWDGRGTDGEFVDPGVYFFTIKSPGDEKRGKIMVLP